MKLEYARSLSALQQSGWKVELATSPRPLAPDVKARYAWVPADIEQFVAEVDVVASPTETAWFLSGADFDGTSSSAFKWNEWEALSLDAADGDRDLVLAISRFWDEHLPLFFSVKSGYAYFALQKSDLSVVRGEEPEFEHATTVAPTLLEFFKLLLEPGFVRWR